MQALSIRSMTNPHSQSHLQFAQASSQTKNCKRACLSSNAFLPTLRIFFVIANIL